MAELRFVFCRHQHQFNIKHKDTWEKKTIRAKEAKGKRL